MSDKHKHKKMVSYRETRDLQKAVELIQEVLDNLKQGTVTVQQDDESITVTPGKNVGLTIKAKHKDEDESIEFKLKWSLAPPADEASDKGDRQEQVSAKDDSNDSQEKAAAHSEESP